MIVLRVDGGTSEDVLVQLKLLARRFPGPHRLAVDVQVEEGGRRVTLGPEWAYEASEGLLAALREFGVPRVTHGTTMHNEEQEEDDG